jgi:hypothetical protein
MNKMKQYQNFYVPFCLFVFLVILLFAFTKRKFNTNVCPCHRFKQDAFQGLIRQTARWAIASQQDTSPMIALLHANYAAGYLQALELIATEDEINQFYNLQKLRLKVYGTQDKAAKKVITTCPNYIGPDIDKELALIGIKTK